MPQQQLKAGHCLGGCAGFLSAVLARRAALAQNRISGGQERAVVVVAQAPEEMPRFAECPPNEKIRCNVIGGLAAIAADGRQLGIPTAQNAGHREHFYREPVMDMQLVQERIANAAMEMFAVTCVLSRWDSELSAVGRNGREAADHIAADLFVRRAFRKTRHFLRGLGDNDDRALLATADAVLGKSGAASQNGA